MIQKKLSILSLTHHGYSEAVWQALGRGRRHAMLAYEEFFRHGKIIGHHSEWDNAQALLAEILQITECKLPTLVDTREDGHTGKFLLKTGDGLEIESVLIPMQSGGTLCVSSQIGCRMGCTFCETGRMGLLRNLTVEEIIAQIFVARHILEFDFRNVVFMGMGEPFDNYDIVMEAVRILQDPHGLAFGRRQITISTSGCIEGIERLITEGDCGPNLAVSVNAPDDEVRNRLMPINRKHNMDQLYQAMQQYCTETGREIFAAYVLLKGHNDTLEHADKLAEYLTGLNVKINLIPYNPQSRDRFEPSPIEVTEAFSMRLRSKGFYTLFRQTKGRDIMAACGQLGNLQLRRQLRNAISTNNSLTN